jgi:hypothetical protein
MRGRRKRSPAGRGGMIPQGSETFKLGDVDGWVLNLGVSTDYMLSRHFGVGIGYNATSLRVDVEQPDFHGRVTWTTQGVMAYGQLRF